MIHVFKKLEQRGCDAKGCGHFGASRGSRKHNGIDYKCDAGDKVLAPASGLVTHLGYCYSDDLTYRYVEITDKEGLRHRVFYISPHVRIGNRVGCDVDVIGAAQDIQARHGKDMRNHVHYEIKKLDNTYLNPEDFHDENI